MNKINSSILTSLRKNTPRLVFALVCGAAYFIIIMRFVMRYTAYAGLMGLFIFPAVVCGAAYIIIKSLRNIFENEDNQNERAALVIFYINIFIILTAVLFAVTIITGTAFA